MRPLFGAQARQGLLECLFGRGSAFCGDLKRCSHRTKEAPHLGNIWHYLAALQPDLKEVVGIRVLLTRLLSDSGIPRSLLLRVSLGKPTSAPVPYRWLR